jgi:hypothetical protein
MDFKLILSKEFQMAAAVKEKTENRINKAKSIRTAFSQLGVDAPSKDIVDYVKNNTGEDVTAQYVYLHRSEYKKGLDPTKAKKKGEAIADSSRKSRMADQSGSFSGKVQNLLKTIRNLVDTCGSKKDLIELIESI